MTSGKKKHEDPSPPDESGPESAPDPGRTVHFRPLQLVSLVILVGIIASALAGTYNHRARTTAVTIGGMTVHVHYTTRTRFQQTEIISVLVTNPGALPIDSLHVSVDTAYLSGFSEVTMIPDPAFPYGTSLSDIPAGGMREVHVSARGDQAGRHRGSVMLSMHGDTVRVPLSTLILP
ncbi:MAG: hypothetical protein ABIV28_07385 [Longimicrobiales bacterium]